MKKPCGNKGFTLMEVMVGIAIAAIISVPLLNMFATSFKVSRHSYDIDNANAVALRTVESIKAGNQGYVYDGVAEEYISYYSYGWEKVGEGETPPEGAVFKCVATVGPESKKTMEPAFLPQMDPEAAITVDYGDSPQSNYTITLKANPNGSYTFRFNYAEHISIGGTDRQNEITLSSDQLSSTVLPVMVNNKANEATEVKFTVKNTTPLELGLFVFGDDNDLVELAVESGGASITKLSGQLDTMSFDKLVIQAIVTRLGSGEIAESVMADYATVAYAMR